MDDSLRLETEKLARSWRQYDAPFLRDYLVADVEDPRLNVQSILSRHFLIATLFGEKFRELGLQELRFAGAMNWLARIARNSGGAEESRAVLHALEHGADNAEGLQIPHFISETFRSLPICLGELNILNYLRDFLVSADGVPTQPRPQSPVSTGLPLSGSRRWRGNNRRRFPCSNRRAAPPMTTAFSKRTALPG